MSWVDEDFSKSETREHFLKECVNSKKVIPVGKILQVAQCVNISVPRKNRETDASINDPKHSIIKVTLTDGKTSVQGLVPDYHPHLSSSTVPGTKVEVFKEIPVVMGLIILDTKNVRVLGGNVHALVEQWNMQITQDKLRTWGFRGNTSGNDGPPQWRPFNVRGGRVDRSDLRNVKAMDLVKEQTEGKSDDPSKSKFDAQRMETISELSKQTQAKSFGEGKRLVDKGVQDIMNEGFSEEQAEEAIRKFKNPKKALKFLKNAKDNASKPRDDGDKDFSRGPRKGRRKGRDKDDDDDGPTGNELGEQPSNSINLFGFIQQKIKTEDEPPPSRPVQDEIRDSFSTSNSTRGGRRDDRSFRKDGESRYTQPDRDSKNGYKRYDGGKPGRFDSSSMQQDHQESRDSYRSGNPRRDGGRENYQRNDNYDQRQYSSDNYRQNDSRNSNSDRYGGNQQGNRYTAQPQRNFAPQQQQQQQQRRGQEMNLEFTNSSHFPSLEDETSSRPPSFNPYKPRTNHSNTGSSFREDFYRSAGVDSSSINNYNRYGREDNQYRHPQGHQTYPARTPHYEGYERSSRNQGESRNFRGGYHDHPNPDQRYNQVEHKFGNMTLRSDYGSDGDWRPSQTMVFTRSKNSGGSGHRDDAYRNRQQ